MQTQKRGAFDVIFFAEVERFIYGATTMYVQQGALADQLREGFARVCQKGVNAPAGCSAQYQVSVFNMQLHSTNTAWETVWKTCNVAFRDYVTKTT